jgi:hypothetical protein
VFSGLKISFFTDVEVPKCARRQSPARWPLASVAYRTLVRIRGMSGYGMAAFDGKDATEGISALSDLVPISPAAQAFPFPAVVPGLQVYIRDKPFVVSGLALERSRGDK